MTDPIADMFVRIKNALNMKNESVDVPHSKIKEGIVRLLAEEGYIARFDVMSKMNKKFIRIGIKYKKGKNRSQQKGVISYLTRVSKPGRRVYKDYLSIPKIQGGFGTAIISTSKGLLTDARARAEKMGGEVIAYVG